MDTLQMLFDKIYLEQKKGLDIHFQKNILETKNKKCNNS